MDSDVRTVRLADGQRVAVDRSLAIRCQACGRLRHFVRRGQCADCRRRSSGRDGG